MLVPPSLFSSVNRKYYIMAVLFLANDDVAFDLEPLHRLPRVPLVLRITRHNYSVYVNGIAPPRCLGGAPPNNTRPLTLKGNHEKLVRT